MGLTEQSIYGDFIQIEDRLDYYHLIGIALNFFSLSHRIFFAFVWPRVMHVIDVSPAASGWFCATSPRRWSRERHTSTTVHDHRRLVAPHALQQ
jgi:hypothetical protein